MVSLRNPNVFLESIRGATESEQIRLWSRVVLVRYFAEISAPLLAAAIESLNSWDQPPLPEIGKQQWIGMIGVLSIIRQRMQEESFEASHLTQRLGSYFKSSNGIVAFSIIREFDVLLPDYTQYIASQLVEAITRESVPSVPGPMSVRAIAFKVLFQFDPRYAQAIELRQAREECVSGCLAWAAESPGSSRGNELRELVARIVELATKADSASR